MSSIKISEILTGIKTTLATATITGTTPLAQEPTNFTEGIVDSAVMQIYPVAGDTDPAGNNDRRSFQAAVRLTEIVVHVDYYARQRSNLDEDMVAVVNGMDGIIDKLEQQTTVLFGLDKAKVKAFKWHWEHVTFVYGDPEVKYAGVRFIITLTVF